MKKLMTYCWYALILTLLLASYSCKKQKDNDLSKDFSDNIPENVHLSDNSTSSITIAWDPVEGATGYTVQLLGSKNSDDKPIVFSPTIFSGTQYQFNGLEETGSYYVRVRAHFYLSTSDWVYVMSDQDKARIMPKYGIVAEDFVPKPEPELYPNFPEGWEVHEGTRKSSYAGTSDVFPSGEWLMPDMYSISTASMAKNRIGDWAMLIKGDVSPYLEMNFDLPNGASKLSFYYGTATQNTTDTNGVPILVTVEYSQDFGITWIKLGEDLVVSAAEDQYFQEYILDIEGPVRFRIGKSSSKARLFVDEIAIYTN